ncbi:glycoside hydrolase family 30 protein [Hymenobacter sp. BT491]|uniref:glycoside hydrolase family 30 protein n=1 Tax=Hymenobacter sp. BT491 TaxID=2766779 RepID=UPI001653500C|nr:glycoside hydrolase family 30 beta sandwich domain-containing protein [Hymenobacter sp. BT491]MBC6991634.1 glucosylceramidase [Hymenobacter sp. BT491]
MNLFPLKSRLLGCSLLALLLVSGCQKKENPNSNPQPTPPATPTASVPSQVAFWLTNPDKSALFTKQKVSLYFATSVNQDPTIVVDTTQTYQTIDGFGYTLTGGSAYVMHQMSAPDRAALIKELFAADSTWLGVSYLRISIGASDLSDRVFTYDDLPSGNTDPNLEQFSLAPETTDLLPVLKEILAINPAIKILGSPWTAPSWMKTNGSPKGGSLKPEYYAAYAKYFVKYIQAMKAQGIRIDAVTLQNEPLNPDNNPSMVMSAPEQAAFIKVVGPALQAAGLDTKIIAYDHNADKPDYPITVLNDADARQYVDGSAFHLYGGNISALTQVHGAFPSKNVYFTEQWVGAPSNFVGDFSWHVNNLIIGATRNWSRNVLEWNLAADPFNSPHTNGGCSTCLPAVTIGNGSVTRNVAYYIIAHASKFVRPGSVRIGTNVPGNLQNVAFKTPTGKKVLIVLNTGNTMQSFNIQYRGKVVSSSLYGSAAGTYVW